MGWECLHNWPVSQECFLAGKPSERRWDSLSWGAQLVSPAKKSLTTLELPRLVDERKKIGSTVLRYCWFWLLKCIGMLVFHVFVSWFLGCWLDKRNCVKLSWNLPQICKSLFRWNVITVITWITCSLASDSKLTCQATTVNLLNFYQLDTSILSLWLLFFQLLPINIIRGSKLSSYSHWCVIFLNLTTFRATT